MFKLALVVVMVFATSCTAPRSRKAGYITGGIMTGTGTAMALAGLATAGCTRNNLHDAIGCGMASASGILLGGLITAGGLYLLGLSAWGKEPAQESAPKHVESEPHVRWRDADTIVAPATIDPMLRQLTRQAAVAARVGHCVAVAVIAERVARIAPAFRSRGFAADPEIERCLPSFSYG